MLRTGGLKSGPFTAGAIYYYRNTFTVKCFLEILHFGNSSLGIAWLAVNKTLRSTVHIKIQRIQQRFRQTRNPTKLKENFLIDCCQV